MDDVTEILNAAGELAHRAITNDEKEEDTIAVYFYFEAISLLERAIYFLNNIIYNTQLQSAPQEIAGLRRKVGALQTKIEEYQRRIHTLQESAKNRQQTQAMAKPSGKSPTEVKKERAFFLVSQALEADEAQKKDFAVELYSEAVELCLELKNSGQLDSAGTRQVHELAKKAIERAEELKGITSSKSSLDVPKPSQEPSTSNGRVSPIQPLSTVNRNMSSSGPTPSPSGHAKGDYSEEEKRVLLSTSIINGREYVPFMSVDLNEKFAYPLPYTDSNGRLHLSPKQRKDFKEWKRPDEMWPEPKMIEVVSCYSIRQTVISDCSFVASLAVSALYERKFQKKLITHIIYPQNRNGEPVYNPCGKYMVKLHLNGVKRKVIIDDLLPVGSRGQLLCSYSSNKGELWVSLLEKAYMKVMGGYDFPGSNSNIDLHALTGWIPERISIHPQDNLVPFDKEKVFRMLTQHMERGNVLVTVATGEMDEQEADRAGIVTSHAYAVLEAVTVKGERLLKLKNPWSHLRWKGNYSELDVTHWTKELQETLNYDPKSASTFDNGVFWIDYNSLCKYFDVFYLNWNPKLFAHSTVMHKTWGAGVGPTKDAYTIGSNPQYCLEVDSKGDDVVWVLLTRHITEIQDFKNNREYITVLVYDAHGRRVFYPYDPKPMIDGVRINSPHYLCKIPVKRGAGRHRFTLVISQYEKMNTIHYTLRAYSNANISLRELATSYKSKAKVTGEWKGRTAGGCPNHPSTFRNNPHYRMHLKSGTNNKVLIELKARKDFQVGFFIHPPSESGSTPAAEPINSGPFRSGYCVLELDNLAAGIYTVVPSTFLPGFEGPFFLDVQATCDVTLTMQPPS